MANKINIIDSTLREGLQVPGVQLKKFQFVEIAQSIIDLGVDTLEVGHPASSHENLSIIKEISSMSKIPCLAHARANKKDILAAYQCGATWVGIFAGINDLSSKYRICKEKSEILSIIKDAIVYAKSLGLSVRYTIEDASRTDITDLLNVYTLAIEAGADRICYADTIGILEPVQTYNTLSQIVNHFSIPNIEAHFHNDRGLAQANALAAIDSGINWISSSVNGLGERCGITDTLVLMANIDFRGIRDYRNSLNKVKYVSDLVAAHTRSFIAFQHPVTGKNAFTHTAKLHVDAVTKFSEIYSWQEASIFGRDNKTSGNLLPENLKGLTNKPPIISAEELRFHRKGPGYRYLMLDERFVSDCRQYCIIRDIRELAEETEIPPHVDTHRHSCDSLFMFIGNNIDLTGLTVAVNIENEEQVLESPISVFIPAGLYHTYKIISGRGLFINHVLSGNYNDSLID